MKIGIFGGCFNPPHNMHLNIAINLIKNNYVDKVIYVPAGNSYQKNELIEFKYRYQMLELMLQNKKNLNVSDIAQNDEYKYTYQILDYFNNDKDKIYFICGTDNLKEFSTWKNYEYILNNYKLLVIKRNNDNEKELLNKYKKYKDSIIFTTIDEQVMSSTYLRNKIKNKENILEYIGKDVYDYILRNGLYGDLNE